MLQACIANLECERTQYNSSQEKDNSEMGSINNIFKLKTEF